MKRPCAQEDTIAPSALCQGKAERNPVAASETADGQARLTSCNRDFEAKMAAAEAIMREDRDILRILAE